MNNKLHRKALLLSWFTVGYNIGEGVLSLFAGFASGSIALVGFGVDSFVESLSGGVMIWRFKDHGNLSKEDEERIERKAARFVGYTFFILASYILYESASKLYFREPADPSLLGIIIAIASLVVMPALFYLKYRTGKEIGAASLVADSKQTLACTFLSVALLAGLGLNYLYGLWQADPVTGLVIVGFLVREGVHTLREEELCSC